MKKPVWVQICELPTTKHKVFACVACKCECIAVSHKDKELGDCPSSGVIVGDGKMKMATNAVNIEDE